MKISVSTDISKTVKKLGRFAGQIPFAASMALNKTAVDVRDYEKQRIDRDLDRPTKQTINGIRYKGSSKRNLAAVVFVIPHIDKFLRYQIHGGTRPARGRTEAVPYQHGVSFRLNDYGNIPGRRNGKLRKLLARPDTFSATIKGVAGIWQRGKGKNKNHVRLLLAYEERTRYRRRFDFYGHAAREINRKWSRHFSESISMAIKTARL